MGSHGVVFTFIAVLVFSTTPGDGQAPTPSTGSSGCTSTPACLQKFIQAFMTLNSTAAPPVQYMTSVTDFASICSTTKNCLTQGGTDLASADAATSNAIQFIYEICSSSNVNVYASRTNGCLLKASTHKIAKGCAATYSKRIETIMQNFNTMSSQLCIATSTFTQCVQNVLSSQSYCDSDTVTWFIQILKEAVAENYPGLCCNAGSVSIEKEGGSGGGYVMVFFIMFFAVGAILGRKGCK